MSIPPRGDGHSFKKKGKKEKNEIHKKEKKSACKRKGSKKKQLLFFSSLGLGGHGGRVPITAHAGGVPPY